jgi:hypothetical protein
MRIQEGAPFGIAIARNLNKSSGESDKSKRAAGFVKQPQESGDEILAIRDRVA